jgi:glycosyltransferase involved in cell wall biosynthesis
MTSPFFSIVIPTRQRHDTLQYAIQTVLKQSYDDFELIIMDNMSTDETRLVVESFQDDRIKYHRSEERLTMSENWEKGLSFAEGEFIFFLGDDDGILPDALSVGARILKDSQHSILAWDRDTCCYWWKSCILKHLQNMLLIKLTEPRLVSINAKEALQRVYRFESSYHILPMIYSSFIHRDLIFEIMLVHGQYFCNDIPDVYSGIVNAYFSDSYLYSFRPLSITGVSGHSTGISSSFPHISDKASSEYSHEIKSRGYSLENHPALMTNNRSIFFQVTDTFLKTKDLFFKDDNDIQVDMKNFLIFLSGCFGYNAETFEEETSLIKELTEKYNIPSSEIPLPQKKSGSFIRYRGIDFRDGSPVGINIDCELLGINTIAEATQLAYSMLAEI